MNSECGPRRSGLALVRRAVGAFCFALLVGCASVEPAGQPANTGFEFGLIGDQQYDAESDRKFSEIMAEVNRSNLAFVVHVGDFRGPLIPPCDDALLKQRKEQFDAFRPPLIYTPGDNDWTDCLDVKAGGYDPVERLAKLRDLFFQGNESLGQQKLTVKRQSDNPQFSKFRENARWTYGNVLFITLHMVGPSNRGRFPGAGNEYRERNAANLAWLKEAFEVARREGNRAVGIFTQANPRFERFSYWPSFRARGLGKFPQPKRPSGFIDFLSALEAETLAFGKPVVLMHGDTHYFRVDKPLFRRGESGPNNLGRQIENFTRVETFGFPESHWVRGIVDLNDPQVFTFKPQIIEKNRFSKP